MRLKNLLAGVLAAVLMVGQVEAASPSQPSYVVRLPPAGSYGSNDSVPGFLGMWFDPSCTTLGTGLGCPRPASTDFPFPVTSASGSAGTTPTTPSYAAPAGATTTQTGGTLSATAGAFTQIAPADTTRKAIRYVNTSNDYVYVYAGTAATPSPANSDPVLPGNSWPPVSLGVVPQDAIFVAAKSLASAPYVLMIFR